MSRNSHQNRPTDITSAPDAITDTYRPDNERTSGTADGSKSVRKRTKATYDLPPVIQEAVAAVAKREDTSASQLVAICLAYALSRYIEDEPDLIDALSTRRPTQTPRFSWNIRVPGQWLRIAETIATSMAVHQGWRKRGLVSRAGTASDRFR